MRAYLQLNIDMKYLRNKQMYFCKLYDFIARGVMV